MDGRSMSESESRDGKVPPEIAIRLLPRALLNMRPLRIVIDAIRLSVQRWQYFRDCESRQQDSYTRPRRARVLIDLRSIKRPSATRLPRHYTLDTHVGCILSSEWSWLKTSPRRMARLMRRKYNKGYNNELIMTVGGGFVINTRSCRRSREGSWWRPRVPNLRYI
jgi:hypothetical protein